MTTLADVIVLMEKIAPVRLAEEWDNPGLQVGRRDQAVRKIRVALDPLPQVVASACEDGVNLLITHHPLIFKPLKRLDLSTPIGHIIDMAIRHQLAIFSAHTNLDSAAGGVNDVLASAIGLKSIGVLAKSHESRNVKLVIYVPKDHEQTVLNALFETGAGNIGEYSCCSFRNPGIGTFKPGEASDPFVGKKGEINHADEVRIEAVVSKTEMNRVIRHIRASHPYETMAYDAYPLADTEEGITGVGRIGIPESETTLADIAKQVREKLNPNFLKMVGNPAMPIRKVALCSGSGSSLMKDFLSSDAELYISGDLRYHDARDAEAAGRALIDIGHFPSEHIIVEILAKKIREGLPDAEVGVCGIETDPFSVS